MTCNTLINIIGKYNHYNILAALNLKPRQIVFIRMKEETESCENTKECIAQKLPQAKLIEHVINEQSPAAIAQIIHKYDSQDTYLNLSGGTKLMGLAAFQAAQGSKILSIYVDNDHERILILNEQLEELMPINTELTVEDIICSSGAEILKHSTELFNKKEFSELVEFMVKNYDMWKYAKGILRNTRIVKQFIALPLFIEIVTDRLSFIEIKSIEKFLKELLRQQLITAYQLFYDHIEFTLSNKEAKAFIMSAGSWLEALTYKCIKEIKEVNDAISGMLFVWDEEIDVHNELDVVAAVDSHLVCVSCKDTEKYDVMDLNELEVYAEHLGGRKVTKILVSTQEPERGAMIFQRAEEMEIHIVLFNGDVREFKDRLNRLLMK